MLAVVGLGRGDPPASGDPAIRELLSAWAIAALALASAACTDPASRWEPGGIYSISGGDDFGVVKILAIDPEAVSIRLYRESFPTRPASVDPGALTLGPIDGPDPPGIGHLPLAPRDFAFWFPVHLSTQPVTEEELDGYRLWKESGGRAFDFDALAAPVEGQPETQP